MTDLLPALRANQRWQSRGASSPAGFWLLTFLFSLAFAGCSDSHSSDFVEFSELQQADAPAVHENNFAPSADSSKDVVAEETEIVATVTEVTDSSVAPSLDHSVDGPTEETAVAASDEIPEVESSASKPEPIKLLIPHRQFRKEGNALRATFDDIDLLKVLNMAPVPVDAADYFPDWLTNLNGAHVRIRGYMRPGYEAEDITEFLFVRDNGECCYGPLPKIYDMIAVELAEGESTDLIEGTPFDVEGTLRIEPHADDVELYGLFFIDDGVITE